MIFTDVVTFVSMTENYVPSVVGSGVALSLNQVMIAEGLPGDVTHSKVVIPPSLVTRF
ncbi:hypothetical protein DPMN_127995 [Dreissena polymorpha]|uniref:Uncharacterized protein n=1 Tax=Dreissena polymorpha TaxID=45954 RepID=A0A9D4JZA5_DREPO|nr:hypothetical protein DPMN_127995 [Dreissena polymorpha]